MRAFYLSSLLALAPAVVSAAEPGAAAGAPAPRLEAPRLIEFVEAPWPEGEARRDAAVSLLLTIDATGTVTDADVAESAGEAFDAAARGAALAFRFEPARRGGVPMASRIRYVYEFRLPPPEEEAPVVAAPPNPLDTPIPADAPADEELVVVVQGESEATRRRNSAESVVVIETEQAQRQAADMGELLARQEGVSVRRGGGLGSNSRFSLNGLSDDQIRIFLDGVPLELAGYPFGLANVPLNLVERVEIYRGVVPVRFGADALGGAINLVSAEPVGTGGSASLLGGAYGTWRLTAAGHHHDESSGFLARASVFADRADNDYRVDATYDDAKGREQAITADRFHDAYQAVGGAVDVGFADLAWAERLTLRLHGARFDKELQHDLTMGNVYGDATWAGHTLGGHLRYEQAFTSDLRVDAVVGYSFRQTELVDVGTDTWQWTGEITPHPRTKSEIGGPHRDQTTREHALLGRFQLTWAPAANHTFRVSVAPTITRRNIEDPRQLDAGVGAALAEDRTQLGVVSGIEYEIDLFDDALETIVFAKDYFHDVVAVDPVAGEVARDMHRFGFGAGSRLRLGAGLQLKGSWELATRLPRTDEIFGDGGLVDPNLDLVPESSHNFNLGIDARDVPTAIGSLRGSVNGFVRSIDDLVVLIAEPSNAMYQNVAQARSQGVEIGAGWTAPGGFLHIDGNVTWQDFRNVSSEGTFAQYEGDRMINRPWFFANASARLEWRDTFAASDELSPYWSTRYVNEFFRQWEKNGARETKDVIASQFVQTTGVHYRVPVGGAVVGATAEIDNVTNEKVFDFFGVQRPGRAAYFKGSIEY